MQKVNKYKMFNPNLGKSGKEICKEKRRYDTKEDAYQKGQEVYKCKYCGKFHRSGKLNSLLAYVRRHSKGRKY